MSRYLMVLCLFLSSRALLAGPGAEAWATITAGDASARAAQAGLVLVLDVDLTDSASPGFTLDMGDKGGVARYRMAFNNIAEGWSWQPQAVPAQEDYYRYKFLPLESQHEQGPSYAAWNPFDGAYQISVSRRYDYFFAFDNLYDFYPRAVDDDAGFVATLPPGVPLPLRMRIVVSLQQPVVEESNTFWKAAHNKPVDFTLRKRYLMGRLEAVCFLDAQGTILTALRPANMALREEAGCR